MVLADRKACAKVQSVRHSLWALPGACGLLQTVVCWGSAERPKLQGWCDGRGGPPAPTPGHGSQPELLVGRGADAQGEEARLAWPSFTPWASGMATSGHSVLGTTLRGAPGCVVPMHVRCGCSRESKWLLEAAPAPRLGCCDGLWQRSLDGISKAWASFVALPNQKGLGYSLDCSELISHLSKGDKRPCPAVPTGLLGKSALQPREASCKFLAMLLSELRGGSVWV